MWRILSAKYLQPKQQPHMVEYQKKLVCVNKNWQQNHILNKHSVSTEWSWFINDQNHAIEANI